LHIIKVLIEGIKIKQVASDKGTDRGDKDNTVHAASDKGTDRGDEDKTCCI